MENLLAIIFPPKCFICNNSYGVICPRCLSQVTILNRAYTLVGGLKVLSIYEYEGIVRKCIKISKYSSRQFAALKKLSAEAVALVAGNYTGFIVIPIPLSRAKERWRGFNHADLIAKELALHFQLPVNTRILKRTKETTSQYKLDKFARKQNIKGAFTVVGDVKSKKVLLVDDVCTSGSTLAEAARALYASGAAYVAAFTLSRKS